jgi:hypothetical protein
VTAFTFSLERPQCEESEMSDGQNKGQEAQQAKGSGSDTVSAAKISAGSSVGNVGESPMPHAPGTGTANEQSRHQDRSAQGKSGSASQASGSQQGAGDTLKQAVEGAQQKASDAYEATSRWTKDTYEEASEWADETFGRGGPSGSRRSGGMQQFVMENPVMVGVAGLAAGLLLGALLPRTRRESEVFGEWSDEVREQGMRYAHQLAQQGRDLVDEALNNPQSALGPEGDRQPGQGPQPGIGPH